MNWVHPTSLILLTWVAAFVQSMPWGVRSGLGVQPDLLPALVVYAAFQSGVTTTAAVAVVAGFSFDSLSSGPFGLTVLPLLGMGMLLHHRRELVLRDSVVTQVAVGGMTTLAVAVGSLMLIWVFGPLIASGQDGVPHLADYRVGGDSGPDFGVRRVGQVLVLSGFGAIGTPVVFRFFGWIDATFNYRPVAPVVIRGDREIKRGRS
jgi:rod shape-determining protein MreD